MNPVRGIETSQADEQQCQAEPQESFLLMNPVRGIETVVIVVVLLVCSSFLLMNPVRGIETRDMMKSTFIFLVAFLLMNPVRGIETHLYR